MDFVRNLSTFYNPPDRNFVAKYLLDFIHEHNMKMNLYVISKEADLFGLLLLWYSATIYRSTLLNILVSGKKVKVFM